LIGLGVLMLGVSLFAYTSSSRAITSSGCNATEAFCVQPRIASSFDTLLNATMPKIATPSWAAPTQPIVREVQYHVETRGSVTADLNEFKSVVAATLNDSRGWSRLGVKFVEVPAGGELTAVLSEASQMTTFSETGCDMFVSCTVGEYIIINQDRWLGGSKAWNATGSSLDDYRRMVINHETGHWLGHGHLRCSQAGQPAGVMQQQTIDMQGCTPNPWPLPQELYSPRLGING
jgi:hypothetical protein